MSLLNAIKRDTKREGVRVTARNNTIIPAFVGSRLLVHNGKEFQPLVVREEMVGQKISAFVACTKPRTYRATNANKNK
jgi:ribosomal protein S19